MERALAGVPNEWLPMFDRGLLDKARGALESPDVTPPIALVFEPFRYGGPEDFDTVIVGQDPYPGQGHAQGVCFSVPAGVALPDSLQRIFDCLDRAGLRRAHPGADGKQPADCGDIRPWAVQGVLMLNATLTTRAGARRAHTSAWKPFFDEFFRRFCAARAANGGVLHFLLWGGDARAYAPVARRHGHAVHEWTHPSPLADNQYPEGARFRMCPHFEEVNSARMALGRAPVVWDNIVPSITFTDGSCPRNGAPDARASFAAVFSSAHLKGALIRGEVRPRTYAFVDEGCPELGVRETGEPATPSNNRAEYLGIIYAFLGLLCGRACGRVELVTDSEVCKDTLLRWLPARLQKGTEQGLKNFDLVMLAWRLLGELRARTAGVTITHVRSHQKEPPRSASPRERFLHRGNHLADRHAELALRNEEPTYAVEVLDSPAVLRALGREASS